MHCLAFLSIWLLQACVHTSLLTHAQAHLLQISVSWCLSLQIRKIICLVIMYLMQGWEVGALKHHGLNGNKAWISALGALRSKAQILIGAVHSPPQTSGGTYRKKHASLPYSQTIGLGIQQNLSSLKQAFTKMLVMSGIKRKGMQWFSNLATMLFVTVETQEIYNVMYSWFFLAGCVCGGGHLEYV